MGLRGGPRTEGLASRLCGCQRRPGGLWPKAARQGQGWAGSEGSGRVRELGRAGPSRAERGHAPTAAIMGWRGPGEGGGSGGGEGRQWVLWDGEAFCGGGGKGEPRLLWDGEAFRHRRGAGGWQEYYGMASPSAAGGGWGGGVILWDRGAPRGSGNGGGVGSGGGRMRLLWDGRALCSQSEWSIMGWHNSQRVCPGGYYGMALYLLPHCEILWDAAGRGRGVLLWDAGAARGGEGGRSSGRRAGFAGYPRFPPAPVPSHRGAPRPLLGPPAVPSP